MYIIVNKKVLNVFNLHVTEIKKFDKDALVKIAESHYYLVHDEKDRKNQLAYNTAKENGWFTKDNTTINFEGLSSIRQYGFEGVREGYYFFVEDDKTLLISKLYDTEKAAETARDELLMKANRMIARLYKVEV